MNRRFLSLSLAIAMSLLALLHLQAPVEAAPADDEARFVALINELRLSEGLEPLEVRFELVVNARSWAGELATAAELSHAADLSVGITSDWAKLGENVGVSPDGELIRLFQAFVDSPTHLQNLLDPQFDSIGVGVVYRDGKIWTAHRFMDGVASDDASVTDIADGVTASRTQSNTAALARLLSDLAS